LSVIKFPDYLDFLRDFSGVRHLNLRNAKFACEFQFPISSFAHLESLDVSNSNVLVASLFARNSPLSLESTSAPVFPSVKELTTGAVGNFEPGQERRTFREWSLRELEKLEMDRLR
jgi:hypothetical protein